MGEVADVNAYVTKDQIQIIVVIVLTPIQEVLEDNLSIIQFLYFWISVDNYYHYFTVYPTCTIMIIHEKLAF